MFVLNPDVALTKFREVMSEIAAGRTGPTSHRGQTAAYWADALDRHIMAGGPLPADWRPDRRAPAADR